MKRLSRTALSLATLTVLTAPQAGCFLFGGYDGPVIEKDDVSLEVYGDNGFRAAGDEGDVYLLIEDTATNVNGWVGETVEEIAAVVRFLNARPENDNEGDWRIYGPHNDDEGKDLSWLVKISGDGEHTAYEAYVGSRGASAGDMVKLLEGDISVDGDQRSGGFTLHMDAVEAHPAMKDIEDSGATLTGSIEVSFTRDVSNEQKTVDIKFNDFREEYFLGDAWYSNETYEYHRDGEGNGDFHLALLGDFDDQAWGGTQTNKLVLDAKWGADEAGRTRGMILEVDNAESGLPNGELIIHECFDTTGSLTWRDINDSYAAEMPSYDMGDESSCTYSEADLDS